jgi:acyl-CoA hydrolase
MGGRLMYWMDIIAAIAAQRHSNRTNKNLVVKFKII